MSPDLSIIIPVLDERVGLPDTIRAARDVGAREILIVDGGSTDGTREWVLSQPDLILIDSECGRGPQLNAGARQAKGEILLFLHADCRLPADTSVWIATALEDSWRTGGCFQIRFSEDERRGLRAAAWTINAHSQALRTATGEQAIFVRRSAYEDAGGYPDWPLFEDLEFVARLRRRGSFLVLPATVTVSPRRWLDQGVWPTSVRIAALHTAYRLGVSPVRLKRYLADVRSMPTHSSA